MDYRLKYVTLCLTLQILDEISLFLFMIIFISFNIYFIMGCELIMAESGFEETGR